MQQNEMIIPAPLDRLALFADGLPGLETKIDRYDARSFGNRLVQWKWNDVTLSLIRDRGEWEIECGLRVGGKPLAEPDFRVSYPAGYLMLVIEQDGLSNQPPVDVVASYLARKWQKVRDYLVETSPFLVKRLVDDCRRSGSDL